MWKPLAGDRSDDDADKRGRFASESAHAVRMTAVEIDAVTGVEHEDFGAKGNLERSVNHEVELLTVVCVLVVVASVGQWIHGDEERIDLPATESGGKRLIAIVVATVDLLTLTGSCDEIAAHAWLFAKEQYIEINAVASGNLTEAVDRRISLAGLNLLIVFQRNAAEIGHFLCRNIQNFTQAFEPLADLLD